MNSIWAAAAVAAPHLDELHVYVTRQNYKINFLVRMPSFFFIGERASSLLIAGVCLFQWGCRLILFIVQCSRAVVIIYDDVFNLLRCTPGCSPLCIRALFSAALAHNHTVKILQRWRMDACIKSVAYFFYWDLCHQSSLRAASELLCVDALTQHNKSNYSLIVC